VGAIPCVVALHPAALRGHGNHTATSQPAGPPGDHAASGGEGLSRDRGCSRRRGANVYRWFSSPLVKDELERALREAQLLVVQRIADRAVDRTEAATEARRDAQPS
jgi:hypothetical protein